MPKATLYHLTWHAERQTYELHGSPGEQMLTVTSVAHEWFDWLETIPSFTFQGKRGHLTVRKETRNGGNQYWYAYHRVGPRLTKKYLGRTTDLTLARLEETAAFLTGAETSPPDEAAVRALSNEKGQDREHSRRAVEVDGRGMGTGAVLIPSAKPGSQRALLLATKLHPPRPRTRLVSRSHLIERLQQGTKGALTLLSAPAGFGKTTLLTQWLAERNIPVSWLALEPEDNDPVRFLTYLLAAIQMHDPDLDMPILALLQARPSAPLQRALAVLTNDLMKRQTGDFALVLDDYQVIDASPIHYALAFLLDHLPPQMHHCHWHACALVGNSLSCVPPTSG